MVSGKTLGLVSLTGYRPGPAMLVTAAFIGPGTVTACASAGIGFGYALLWALVFATLSTVILQNMAARVAIVTGQGLAEAILAAAASPAVRWAMAALIFAALGIGNSAYQAGNISGTGLGLALLGLGDDVLSPSLRALGIGALAATLVIIGKPAWLEKLLIALVLAMALAFVGGLLVIDVDWGAAARGISPTLPSDSLFTAIALIGTTVVPYNLFLHAASVRGQFSADRQGIAAASLDTAVSVTLGGLLSMAVVIMGAATSMMPSAGGGPLDDVAMRLEELFGSPARIVFALGLVGAGFSSSLTAPLATGYVLAEMLGNRDDVQRRTRIFKRTALAVIAIGTGFAVFAVNPVELILIAQSANGLLLPILAAFLLWVASRKASLGTFANGPLANIAGGMVVLVCTLLGLRLILRAAGVWP
ncbi:Nramp family divalent metal transporter [Blastomonas sp.]|uniref:Nramp family divalent metal transporter n=1 Tax=Blastomonas sp. TaxID=1909299 RepID=UPI00261439D2|nr:Nramp family divalent metal transporter [Blastomonas sp.]MDM7957851.1 Nramp family divalent metal transporter [Blastomonas sp.]